MQKNKKWNPIERSEYFRLHNDQMTVIEMYTDIDGNSYHWSTGIPTIWTVWGIAGKPLLKWEKIGNEERFFKT